MYTCVYIYIIRIRMNKYMSNIQNIASRKHVRRFRMTPSGKLTIAILNGYILQLAMSHGYKKRKLLVYNVEMFLGIGGSTINQI